MTIATPVLGVNVDERPTTNDRGIALGTRVSGTDGRDYIFVIAGGVIPAGTGVVSVADTTFVATDTGGTWDATTEFASGEYGWLRQASIA